MTPEELADYIRERLGDKVTHTSVAYGQLTLTLDPQGYSDAAQLCKEDEALAFDFFDFLSAIDEREDGFSVVTHLYSVSQAHHINLKVLAPGGREAPKVPSLTGFYRGANWHERETYDMFGIDFEGHPGLEPRILSVETFEGWPLRKDFLLTSREAKPWPGLKEPEDRAPEKITAGAAEAPDPGVSAEEKAQLAKERAERAKKKAAEARARKAAERAGEVAGDTVPEGTPEGADAARGATPAPPPESDADDESPKSGDADG